MSRNRTRRPIIIETKKDGKITKEIGCPFCKPSHPLLPNGQVSHCGTYLSIEAVQNIYFEKNLTCIVCGKGNGTMIKVGQNYRHIHDCSPGKKLFSQAPKFSKVAEVAWKLLKDVPKVQKFTGIIPIEVTDDKGKILGYTFDKP